MAMREGTGGRPLADVALFALIGLTLDTLGSVTLWLDEAAFARYSRMVDGSGVAATAEFVVCFGPALWLLLHDWQKTRRESRLQPWRRRAWLLFDGLALAHLAAYVLLLRLPWIAERVTARARVDLWSARLSATIGGVPLTAFLLTVGTGIFFVATGSAALRAIRDSGFMQKQGLARGFTAAIWLVCGLDCGVSMLILITFATGGLF